MTDGAMPEVSDEKTRGKLAAFDELLAGLSPKVTALREKSVLNDGARKACAILDERMLKESQNAILRGEKDGTPPEEVKLIVEGMALARKVIVAVGQDFLQESLMLKGEARALQAHAQELQTEISKAAGNARRKAEMQAEMNEERDARAEKRGNGKAKAKTKVKTKTKAKTKGGKASARH